MPDKLLLIFCIPLLLSACAGSQYPTPYQSDVNDNHILTTTAAQGQVYVLRKDGRHYLCSRTRPDAAFDQSEGGSVALSLVDASSESSSLGESSNEVELAGRTPAVLMSRELFFRTCEFSWNYDLSEGDAKAMFNKTLDGVLRIWEIEAGNTKVSIGDSVGNASSTALSVNGNATGRANAGASSTNNSSSNYDDDDDDDSDE